MKFFNVILMFSLMCVCFAASAFTEKPLFCPSELRGEKFTNVSIINGKVNCVYGKNAPGFIISDVRYEPFEGDGSYWNLEPNSNTGKYSCTGKGQGKANMNDLDKEANASNCPFYPL
jgi:hypothetical protein